MRRLHCYLEIASAGASKATDSRIYGETLKELKSAKVFGCDVVALIDGESKPFEMVPDFGHNSKCKCPNPEGYGVLRYLGLDLLVAGDPESDIMGAYELAAGRARLEVTGHSTMTVTIGRRSLKKIVNHIESNKGPCICSTCGAEDCEHWYRDHTKGRRA